MFLHNLKYELKVIFRAKEFIIWLMLFPIVLGTLFKVAMGSIYENNDKFSAIPVAVVEREDNAVYKNILTSLSEGDEPALKVTYTDEESAKQMLFDGKVTGILSIGETAELSVGHSGMSSTILKEIVAQFGVYETVIKDTFATDPSLVPDVIKALSADVQSCRETPVTKGNTDVYLTFFYNLIGMVAICGSMAGLSAAMNNQANQSALGARKNCSPTPKRTNLSAAIIATFAAQSFCMILCVTFLRFVLRINFGGNLFLLYVAAILAGFVGNSLGFFIGSVGRLKFEAKNAISLVVSLGLCFLSGLMVANMKPLLAKYAPWVNAINPVAIMSDSFYCLNIYSDYRRFITKVIGMCVYTVVFVVLGIVFSRRKRYASI